MTWRFYSEVAIMPGGRAPGGHESGQDPVRVLPSATCVAHSLFGEEKGGGMENDEEK